MKKHIIGIVTIICILAIAGGGLWWYIHSTNASNLYELSVNFCYHNDTTSLQSKISEAENLYHTKVSSGENRLTTLQSVIVKLDTFEKDLTSYLSVSNVKASKTKSLNKKYKSLQKSRNQLLHEYDEYITRMKGNISIEGDAVKALYNKLFEDTANFVYNYSACFNATSNYVFSKVYKASTLKTELYKLYNASISNLLNNISNSQFYNTNLITRLNHAITLSDSNIVIKSSVEGGEFSDKALKFKQYFNSSDMDILVNNFETYYTSVINPDTEVSNEKLAVYYLKQILEM